MLQSDEVQVFKDPSCRLGSFLVELEGHPIISGAFHIISPHDFVPTATSSILHEEDVVALVDLSILDGEHSVRLGN
jgi:hypothetical protein